MRAWFNGRTSPCQGLGPGSIPGARTNEKTLKISVFFHLSRQESAGSTFVRESKPD